MYEHTIDTMQHSWPIAAVFLAVVIGFVVTVMVVSFNAMHTKRQREFDRASMVRDVEVKRIDLEKTRITLPAISHTKPPEPIGGRAGIDHD